MVDKKEKEIKEIERIKASLEYHFQEYNDYKLRSTNASKKIDRNKASDDMFTHAKYIEMELLNPLIFSIISDGNPFQFEDFWKYVNSDLPKYLIKIESFLEKIKSEKEEQ